MVIAALIAFGALLVAWIMAPGEREPSASQVPTPLREVTAEAA